MLIIRCQLSSFPAHDPTLPRDPLRTQTSVYGPKQAQSHTDYDLRYCRLCTPDPETWGPYTVPGRNTPIGNEEHLIFHCPMLRATQQNLKQDMQEVLHTFKRKCKGNNMPVFWAAIPIETQITLVMGSAPPAQWGLSFLKTQKWIYMIRNAIDSCLQDIHIANTNKRKYFRNKYNT
jgi:hypothetical protein